MLCTFPLPGQAISIGSDNVSWLCFPNVVDFASFPLDAKHLGCSSTLYLHYNPPLLLGCPWKLVTWFITYLRELQPIYLYRYTGYNPFTKYHAHPSTVSIWKTLSNHQTKTSRCKSKALVDADINVFDNNVSSVWTALCI